MPIYKFGETLGYAKEKTDKLILGALLSLSKRASRFLQRKSVREKKGPFDCRPSAAPPDLVGVGIPCRFRIASRRQ